MRRRLSFLLAGVAVLLAASAVSAGTLTQATWFQVTQGIPMTRSNGPDCGTTGFFDCFGADGTSAATSIAVDIVYPQFTSEFFVPKTANGTLDLAIHITQGNDLTANGAAIPQVITATANAALGTPGIPGTVLVMTAAHVAMGANQSMFMVGPNTLVQVPLSNGKAGQFTGTFTVIGALHRITVDFYAWTPGTLTFNGLTSKNLPLSMAQGGVPADNTVVAMGSFDLVPTANGLQTVTLVSPSKISIDGSLAQRRTASFTKLKLAFVIPEPGGVLLLVGGALGLVLMGSLRR